MIWRETWSLGVAELDGDHRFLATLIERIAAICADAPAQTTAARGRCARLLERLGDEARAHFAREEALMRQVDYPWTAAHASEHALLSAEYRVLLRELGVGDGTRSSCPARSTRRIQRGTEIGPPRPRLCTMPTLPTLESLDEIKHWFLGHILDADRRLAVYLRKIGLASPALH